MPTASVPGTGIVVRRAGATPELCYYFQTSQRDCPWRLRCDIFVSRYDNFRHVIERVNEELSREVDEFPLEGERG